jgi:hypothetical protein
LNANDFAVLWSRDLGRWSNSRWEKAMSTATRDRPQAKSTVRVIDADSLTHEGRSEALSLDAAKLYDTAV